MECYQRDINKLCNKYKFQQTEYFDGIQIITPSDWWVIKFCNSNSNIIKLYHKNKRHGTGYHHQRNFKNNIHKVFEYIAEHELKPFRVHEKMFRIKELLTMIN